MNDRALARWVASCDERDYDCISHAVEPLVGDGDREQARRANVRLAKLAADGDDYFLSRSGLWVTVEPFSEDDVEWQDAREAMYAMWAESEARRPRRGKYYADLDRKTLPLFAEWVRAIEEHVEALDEDDDLPLAA